MAGIGFRLQSYFGSHDLLRNLRGAIYSVFISSGPWLITIFSLAYINSFSAQYLADSDKYLYKAIVSYAYAFSLIIFGAIEMPITRYLADKLFLKDLHDIRPLYYGICVVLMTLGLLTSVLFFSFVPVPFLLKITSFFFVTLTMLIWPAMIFLSAAKHFHVIVMAFIVGALTMGIAGQFGLHYWGVGGLIGGMSCGQLLVFLILTVCIYYEYESFDFSSFEIFNYFRRFKKLSFAGLFYYLGVWVDKFIFWFSSCGQQIIGPLYTNTEYDTALFLAYLTILPALTIFVVQIETNFYVKYLYYFKLLDEKSPLSMLDSAHKDMMIALKQGLNAMIKVQSLASFTIWFFAADILAFLRLPTIMVSIFRFGVLGTYFQSLFMIFNIILLYFNAQKPVLLNYAIFFLANSSLSIMSLYAGKKYYAFGYALSSFITLCVSYYKLNYHLQHTHEYVFMGQPLRQKHVYT
ncbi:MAG: exopolysaccharide Pel transporter PelG [Bdellovibrio sp.]|nr:exopolysaccharide Pel transporter PelG [Bdellovibrio sp.]